MNGDQTPVPNQARMEGRHGGYRISALAALVILLAAFAPSLFDLIRYSLRSDLYSYIVLVPFIVVYLIRLERVANRSGDHVPAPALALSCAVVGAAALAFLALRHASGMPLSRNDHLSITTFAFVTLLLGTLALLAGREPLRGRASPLLFLYFMVPLPDAVGNLLATLLQHGSAALSTALLNFTDTPVFTDGVTLYLPGLTLEVAQECSGIRSTMILFITSLLLGHLFLRSPWLKSALVLSVIPIGVLRNSARILTIALLTIRVNPEVIHGPLHKHGGTPFFVFSLIPLFLLLLALRLAERERGTPANPLPEGAH